MARDYAKFPDDENGDVLWRMCQAGDDVNKPRVVDFAVIFPSEEAALQFAVHLLRSEQKVSFAPYPEHAEKPWEVLAHPTLVPSHENITAYENQLARDAEPLGGRNDGWGCIQQD